MTCIRSLIAFALPLAAFAQTPDIISTYAGGGPPFPLPALKADLAKPVNTAVDSSGNYYIAANAFGFYFARVYKVDTFGRLTVLAGTGFPGYSGDGGPATEAQLGEPEALAADSAGNVYIADAENCAIRKVTQSTGIISTIAGMGPLSCGYSGDGGPAADAQLETPSGIALDSSGDLYVADPFYSVIRKIAARTGIITTVAGRSYLSASCQFSGDGGPATEARLCGPSSVAVDGSGNVYIADTANYRIRKVTTSTRKISTIAGNGVDGFSGDGGPATSAEISDIYGLASDSSGDVFIADYDSCVIREVSGGKINSVAGQGQTCGYSGDGGLAIAANLFYPSGVAVDSSANLYIADTDNNLVRKAALHGDINRAAGNGSAFFYGQDVAADTASLSTVHSAVPDASGNVYIADTENSVVRKVNAKGVITTFAGKPSLIDNFNCDHPGDGGPATSACLVAPEKAVPDSSGNVYIPDDSVVRKVNTSGIISTVAGNGIFGYSGDGGPATEAELGEPEGVALDSSGNLYIADAFACVIRKVDAQGIISTFAGNGTCDSSGDGGPATTAALNNPSDVATDALGRVYIADTNNNRVRIVSDSNIYAFAGNGNPGYAGDGGPAVDAELTYPIGVAVDVAGDVLIGDSSNRAVRFVDGQHTIHTVAGNGNYGFSGDGGPATKADLALPSGVGVNPAGDIFIADAASHRIRKVTAVQNLNSSIYKLTFPVVAVGASETRRFILHSVGPLDIESISVSGTNGDFSEQNHCPSKLASGSACEVNVTFKPCAKGAKSGAVTIKSNSFFNPTLTVALAGTGQ